MEGMGMKGKGCVGMEGKGMDGKGMDGMGMDGMGMEGVGMEGVGMEEAPWMVKRSLKHVFMQWQELRWRVGGSRWWWVPVSRMRRDGGRALVVGMEWVPQSPPSSAHSGRCHHTRRRHRRQR